MWNIEKIKEKRITQIEKIKLSINMILCSYASQNNTLVQLQLKKNTSEFSPIWPNQLGNGRCSIQGPISTDHSMQYVEPLKSTVSAK